jgi:hypothetical protein
MVPLKVITSLESPDGSHCVDIFVRDDASFGFEEFRGEFDGAARWQSLGRHGSLVFASGEAALAAAQARVPWLGTSASWRW